MLFLPLYKVGLGLTLPGRLPALEVVIDLLQRAFSGLVGVPLADPLDLRAQVSHLRHRGHDVRVAPRAQGARRRGDLRILAGPTGRIGIEIEARVGLPLLVDGAEAIAQHVKDLLDIGSILFVLLIGIDPLNASVIQGSHGRRQGRVTFLAALVRLGFAHLFDGLLLGSIDLNLRLINLDSEFVSLGLSWAMLLRACDAVLCVRQVLSRIGGLRLRIRQSPCFPGGLFIAAALLLGIRLA